MKASLKTLLTLMVLTAEVSVAALMAAPSRTFAFGLTEEQQWAADIDEAKKRARDFRRYQADMIKRVKERESASDEIKKVRDREEAEREAARIEYVRFRKQREKEQLQRERLEQEWEKLILAEQKKRDQVRASYVSRRKQVQELLRKQAHIDGTEEYELKWEDTGKPALGPNKQGP